MTLSSDSVVVLTGAASGIGRALTVNLAAEGIRAIAVSDVDESGLAETAELVSSSETEVHSAVMDVSDRDQFRSFADEALSRFGRVTHVINNAGVGMVGRTEQLSFEDIEWMMNINFWGTVYGTKIFLPVFTEQDFGHVVNISSVFGLISPPGQAAYCASKFAVRGFTEALRHELEGSNVCVSCVHPGGIRTNIVKNARRGRYASDEDMKLAPIMLEKLAKSTAEQAANTIIKGIKSNNPRILIGPDARQISMVQRLFPKRYFKIMDRLTGGMLSKYG